MRLEEKNKNSLEKFRTGDGPDPASTDSELAEAMELLYAVMNASYASSGTPLEVEENGQRESIQGLYWRCKETLCKIGSNPDKTGFLAMSALEHTWELARGLVLCPVSDMLDGDMSMLDNARRLEAILADNAYKKIWAEKSAAYVAILERIGFSPEPDAFSDLTKIMDPLLDALSFYAPQKSGVRACIYEVRHGKPSESRRPAIAKAMCMYRSEKELADAVMGSGQDCLMAFGAVEKTHAQVKDYFYEWMNGFPEERQRNMMHNDKLTEEQYLAAACDYTRCVYLCVKSGGRCWLVSMPWKGDYYSRIGDPKAEFYYGKRASYAPYQIFYKNAAPAPEGSTMLAVRKTGYLLSELMDPMSMAWYPAFLDETMKLFFDKNGTLPDTKELIFAEEAAAEGPSDGNAGKDKYAVVPVYSGVPAVCSWKYAIKPPAGMFPDDPDTLYLLDYFGISEKDVTGIPILPEKNGSPDAMLAAADERLKKAYLKLLADRIADLMEGRWDARRWLLKQMQANMDGILEMAGNGDLMAFMKVTVDGTPVLNPDGTPKMVKRQKYPWDEIPETVKTAPEDGREDWHRLEDSFSKMVFWYTKPTSGRPPVVWHLEPSAPEHYAMLAGTDVDALPETLRLADRLSAFYKAHSGSLPGDLTNKYAALGYGQKKKSIYVPCFGRLNICMTKKAYKTFGYFK